MSKIIFTLLFLATITLSNHGECNEDLLKAFGITLNSEAHDQPHRAKAASKNLCTRNRYTCCTGEEILSTAENFGHAAKSLRRRLEVLEELLTLFVGESYRKILIDAHSGSCVSVFEEFKIYKKSKNFKDFSDVIVKEKVDQILVLLTDLSSYKNRNLWFYQNQICTVCNPFEVEFFVLNENGSTIKKHVNNCYHQLEISEFEIRLMTLFEEVILLFVKAAKCVHELNDTEYKIDSVDLSEVNHLKKEFVGCYEFFDYKSEECQKLCHEKEHYVYNFPAKIWGPVGQSLKILFKALIDGDIEEYYENIKGYTFQDYIPDDPIIFFHGNETFDKFKLGEATYEIDSTDGVSYFTDHMAKAYKNWESSFGNIIKIGLAVFFMLF